MFYYATSITVQHLSMHDNNDFSATVDCVNIYYAVYNNNNNNNIILYCVVCLLDQNGTPFVFDSIIFSQLPVNPVLKPIINSIIISDWKIFA